MPSSILVGFEDKECQCEMKERTVHQVRILHHIVLVLHLINRACFVLDVLLLTHAHFICPYDDDPLRMSPPLGPASGPEIHSTFHLHLRIYAA